MLIGIGDFLNLTIIVSRLLAMLPRKVMGVESEFSDRLWLELSLDQAEQYQLHEKKKEERSKGRNFR